MQEAHTSSEFDELLDRARLLLSQMGARVERQVEDAIQCLGSGSALLIDQVMRHEVEINELERIADEAKKIALRARSLAEDRWPSRPRHYEVASTARLAVELVGQAVGALDRLDASRVADAAARENQLDMLFVAKSFERIGDHATNIFGHVIYAVRGENLRHGSPFSS
jgi:phosphate transport system protein